MSLGCASREYLANISQATTVFISHHKSGTLATAAFLLDVCGCSVRTGTWWSMWTSGCHHRCLTKKGIIFLCDGLPFGVVLPPHALVVHLVRDPVAMVVSSYKYHLACPEAWTFSLPMSRAIVTSSDRFGNFQSAHHMLQLLIQTPAPVRSLPLVATNVLEQRRIVARLRSHPTSYCALLRRASVEVGTLVEVIRNAGAADGTGNMARLDEFLSGPRFHGQHLNLVTSSLGNYETWHQLLNVSTKFRTSTRFHGLLTRHLLMHANHRLNFSSSDALLSTHVEAAIRSWNGPL